MTPGTRTIGSGPRGLFLSLLVGLNLPATQPHAAQCLTRHDKNPESSRFESTCNDGDSRDAR